MTNEATMCFITDTPCDAGYPDVGHPLWMCTVVSSSTLYGLNGFQLSRRSDVCARNLLRLRMRKVRLASAKIDHIQNPSSFNTTDVQAAMSQGSATWTRVYSRYDIRCGPRRPVIRDKSLRRRAPISLAAEGLI